MFGAIYYGQAYYGGQGPQPAPAPSQPPVVTGPGPFNGLYGALIYGDTHDQPVSYPANGGPPIIRLPVNPPIRRQVTLSPVFSQEARQPNAAPSARIRSIKLTVDEDKPRVQPIETKPPQVQPAWRSE